ncbi:MAG TPA: hypothetical protein VGO47_08720 [Chlamydiales bacterium]|nr:hypothetical protein [Chlamydiales bacterium]
MHRYIPIPYNVDEDLLLEMLQKKMDVTSSEEISSVCAFVAPRKVGGSMKQCRKCRGFTSDFTEK